VKINYYFFKVTQTWCAGEQVTGVLKRVTWLNLEVCVHLRLLERLCLALL